MPNTMQAIQIPPLIRPGPTVSLLSSADIITLTPTPGAVPAAANETRVQAPVWNPDGTPGRDVTDRAAGVEVAGDIARDAGIVLNRDVDGMRWLAGVKEQPYVCSPARGTLPLDCPSPNSAARTPSTPPATKFTFPFQIFVGVKCSTFGWEGTDFVGRARAILAAYEASLVEYELWTGTAAQVGIGAGMGYPADQWLARSSVVNLTPGGAVSPVQANALAQEALSIVASSGITNEDPCAGGSPAMWHVPRKALPALFHSNLFRRDGNRILTLTDDVVVPGSGYPGTGPNGEAATATSVWTYVTDPIRILRDDTTILPDTYSQAINRTTNDVTFWGQRTYLTEWARCCAFAINVSTDS